MRLVGATHTKLSAIFGVRSLLIFLYFLHGKQEKDCAFFPVYMISGNGEMALDEKVVDRNLSNLLISGA